MTRKTRSRTTHPHRLIPMAIADDWYPGYSAGDSTTGLLVDREDDNDGFTDKEEEAGTDSMNAGEQPVSSMSILLIKQAIDVAAAGSQQ